MALAWVRCAGSVRSLGEQLAAEGIDAVGDVVADKPHAVGAVDSMVGGFVEVPGFDGGAVHGFDVGFAAEDYHEVGCGDEFGVMA